MPHPGRQLRLGDLFDFLRSKARSRRPAADVASDQEQSEQIPWRLARQLGLPANHQAPVSTCPIVRYRPILAPLVRLRSGQSPRDNARQFPWDACQHRRLVPHATLLPRLCHAAPGNQLGATPGRRWSRCTQATPSPIYVLPLI
jgi:hypothetical protein